MEVLVKEKVDEVLNVLDEFVYVLNTEEFLKVYDILVPTLMIATGEITRTLDIINTAFLTADANGNFSSTTALNDIYDYIFPKAKIHGNWVVFSIAPESKWSDIAISATKIENFANNIVDIINTHGFDGVDIDWETPRSGEQVRYSNMMKVIYDKVKANNPNHLVTTAITGGMWQPPMYNLSVSNAYLDYINVMTYSMSSSAGSYQNALYNRSGFHNPESRVGQTPTSVSIDASVPIFNSYGVPNSKLIFGLKPYTLSRMLNPTSLGREHIPSFSTAFGVSFGENSIRSPITTPETPPSLISIVSLTIETRFSLLFFSIILIISSISSIFKP